MSDGPVSFVVNHRPFLTAVGNDVLLRVDRSLAVSVTDPRYRPIAEHIETHRMVLVEREAVTDDPQMYGRTEMSRFATPEARQLLMMNFEEET